MSAALVGLLVCLAPALQDSAYDRAMAALAEGEPGDAWKEIETEPDPIQRQRGRAAILLAAGDFAGELQAAEQGLGQDPDDQELLYYAAHAALWVRDDRRADAYVERLARSLERHPPPDDAREAWNDVVTGFRANADELASMRAARESAVERARRVSYAILGVALLGMLVLALRAGPGVPSGTRAP